MPRRLIKIIPAYRFRVNAAVIINGIIIAHFAELPDHFRPGNGKEKRRRQFDPRQRRRLVLDVVAAAAVAPLFVFEHQPFFIMAFHIGHQVGLIPSAPGINAPGKIGFAVFIIAHRCFVKVVIKIAPQHHALRGQLFFLAVFRKMLQNDKRLRVNAADMIGYAPQNGNAGIVVCPAVAAFVGKSFGEIKTIAVDVILPQPMLEDAVDKGLCCRALVIKVITP